jgi:hypothetical protein
MRDTVENHDKRIEALEENLSKSNDSLTTGVKASVTRIFNAVQQDTTLNGLYSALVIDTFDIWKQNRVRYFTPILHNPKKVNIKALPWAYPISTLGGFDDSGVNWVPPAGSTVCLIFEHGNRKSAYYLGTTWTRDRGPNGDQFGIPVPEWDLLYAGNRSNYYVGPNDGSQVFPPWNTESYNGYDINSTTDIDLNVNAARRMTFPNIYGFKTPEKHMLKMVDGDAKCNRKWKRMELMSGCGAWMCFKDDHLHYGGQWAFKNCSRGGSTNCIANATDPNPSEDVTKQTFNVSLDELQRATSARQTFSYFDEGYYNSPQKEDQGVPCDGSKTSSTVIGGHPDTPSGTTYADQQTGSNPYFKAKNECRPYRGPGTPQNNKCDLPQSGIQFLSISGHSFVMDDSVEEPRGTPDWERSLKSFDFGCNDKYLGRSYWKSCTGHSISLIDFEQPARVRNNLNGINLTSALGNKIFLCDHTDSTCPGLGGSERGIHIKSTSQHILRMSDASVDQKESCRKDGNLPINNAKEAYVQLRSGYGLEIFMGDYFSQTKTDQQFIRIQAPQKDNTKRGPHFEVFQEAPSGPGYVFLRAGGNYIQNSYDETIEVVGEPTENPSDKISLVTKDRFCSTANMDIRSNKYFINMSEKYAFILAGLGGCKDKDGNDTFCVAPVIVYMGGKLKISDRVFATCTENAPTVSITMLSPLSSMFGNSKSNTQQTQENQETVNAQNQASNAAAARAQNIVL